MDGLANRLVRVRLSVVVLAGFVLGFGVTSGVLLGADLARALACTSNPGQQGTGGDDNYTDPVDKATTIDMLAGDDDAEMGNCNDTVYGGGGFDELHGAAGVDNVLGQGDNDRPSSCDPNNNCGGLHGGSGNDTIRGGAGLDDLEDIQAGSDTDNLYGEGENDVLSSTDGDGNDRLDGGAGTDNCQGDTSPPDTKVNCP